MEYNKELFKKNIKFIREKNNLSQAKFAAKLDVSQHMISVYESNDDPNPTLDMLIRISNYSNTSIEALLTLDLEENLFNYGMRKPSNGSNEYSYFEGMKYYVYYLTENVAEPFYDGYIQMDEKYDNEHFFLHGKAKAGHEYDCKMVIEGTDNFYIYGTEVTLPRRFHLLMYYPDFRKEEKYQAGLGILSRLNTKKQIAGMRLAVTSKKLDLQNAYIRDELKYYLTTGENPNRLGIEENSYKIAVNHDLDNEFRNWVNSLPLGKGEKAIPRYQDNTGHFYRPDRESY